MSSPSILRKRQLTADRADSASVPGELDIASCATIAFTSEDPAHPVEHPLDGSSGPGATRWASARADTIEQILVNFDKPQVLTRLAYEVEEATTSAPQGPVFSVKNTDSAFGKPAISVSRLFQTKTAPAGRPLLLSVSSLSLSGAGQEAKWSPVENAFLPLGSGLA